MDNVNDQGEVTQCDCLCHTRGVRQHGNKDCSYCRSTNCGADDASNDMKPSNPDAKLRQAESPTPPLDSRDGLPDNKLDELRHADKLAINKICDVFSMDEALDLLDERIAAHTDQLLLEARIDMASWLNVWLIQHDQAPADSGRISIKAADVLRLQANLMDELKTLKDRL